MRKTRILSLELESRQGVVLLALVGGRLWAWLLLVLVSGFSLSANSSEGLGWGHKSEGVSFLFCFIFWANREEKKGIIWGRKMKSRRDHSSHPRWTVWMTTE